MCGIFVAFNPRGLSRDNNSKYISATSCAKHRGPDNTQFFEDEKCFMGFNRLSIIGLESSSNQPFEEREFKIVFNGEIFNYIELREELINLGHKFRTNSDTEVVLKSFIQWGPDSFRKFNGMWSLVVYNQLKNTITICRDRFGQKPLFITSFEKTYYVFSELQQFHKVQKQNPNFNLIRTFLRSGTYQSYETFFSNVFEFPKARYLELNLDDKVNYRSYWSYPTKIKYKNSRLLTNQFNTLLEDSVLLRLRSDVDLGFLISGGIDSTIIASISRDYLNDKKKINGYTYSSKDKFDETNYAKVVSSKLNLKSNFISQEKDSSQYISRLRNLVQHLGRGHSSPAIVSIDYLYEKSKQDGIKVILDGQGADELLAGYRQYYFPIFIQQLKQLRFKQFYFSFNNLIKIGKQFNYGIFSVFILFLRNNLNEFFLRIMRIIYGYEKIINSQKITNSKSDLLVSPQNHKNQNLLNYHLIYQHNYGLYNLLYYGDIVAMKNSVENRSPFMDHRLVEFVFECDEDIKVFDGFEKFALRNSSHYSKFEEIFNRDKIGFESQINYNTKLEMVKILSNSRIINWPIFKKNKFIEWIQSSQPTKPKYERFLFRIFQVHLWSEIFDKKGIK